MIETINKTGRKKSKKDQKSKIVSKVKQLTKDGKWTDNKLWQSTLQKYLDVSKTIKHDYT